MTYIVIDDDEFEKFLDFEQDLSYQKISSGVVLFNKKTKKDILLRSVSLKKLKGNICCPTCNSTLDYNYNPTFIRGSELSIFMNQLPENNDVTKKVCISCGAILEIKDVFCFSCGYDQKTLLK